METLLSNFPFSFLLRSFFAGVFFALPTVILGTFAQSEKDSSLTWIGVSLISGVVLYSIHRAAIYPWFERCFDSERIQKTREERRLKNWFICENTIKVLIARWARGKNCGNNPLECNKSFAGHISVWADYTHMLYVACWCSLAGTLVAWLDESLLLISWKTLVFLVPALIFLLSALFSDFRLHYVEDYLRRNLDQIDKTTVKTPVSNTLDSDVEDERISAVLKAEGTCAMVRYENGLIIVTIKK